MSLKGQVYAFEILCLKFVQIYYIVSVHWGVSCKMTIVHTEALSLNNRC